MTGFESPNYTQVPNDLLGNFSDVGLMADMGLAELKVLLALCRLTFGYHRGEVDTSLSVLERMTGLTRMSVNEGAKALEKRGLISRQAEQGKVTHWSIVTTSIEDVPVQQQTSIADIPVTSIVTIPYKESIERNNIKKEDGDLRKSPQPPLLEVDDLEHINLDPQRKSDQMLQAAIAEETRVRTGRNSRGPRTFETIEQKRRWRASCATIEQANNGTAQAVLLEFISKARAAGRRDRAGIINYVVTCAENGGRLFTGHNQETTKPTTHPQIAALTEEQRTALLTIKYNPRDTVLVNMCLEDLQGLDYEALIPLL